MKYELIIGLLVASVLGGAFALNTINNQQANPTTPTPTPTIESTTQTMQEQSQTTQSETGLTQEEINGILFMREEEKLARDVYLTFYKMYGLPIFKNIAESEQRHMDAVLTLIQKYNLTDPATNEVGVFTNKTLQELYDKLIAEGSKSLVNAVKVGGLIEEKDIIDINKLINETSNPDIIRVYTYLVNGSAHHLLAFSTQYEKLTGQPYQPQLLTPQQYEAVISSVTNGPSNGRGQG
ncbi:MAG: DUF2202 domain-containing protein [Desulfurococcales archaeon]|nr:DUF2202 domain-containing protein [Desulfurococcales archaeon]